VTTDNSGHVLGFVEKGQGGPGWISAGVYLLKPSCIGFIAPGQSASIEQDAFPQLTEQGSLCAFRARARFLDIGTPESYAQAGRFLLGLDADSTQQQCAVFLDRDGTVIVDKHYLHDPNDVELLPGAAKGMRRLADLGLRLVLISNQSGVGRGYFGRGDVERVHGRLLDLLEPHGVSLDALYVCPHAPDEGCRCRKPEPGLFEQTGERYGMEFKGVPAVGDSVRDLVACVAAGCEPHLVLTGKAEGLRGRPLPEGFPPNTVVHLDLTAFADFLTRREAPEVQARRPDTLMP